MKYFLVILISISILTFAQTWEDIGPVGRSSLVVMPDPVNPDSIYTVLGAPSDIRLELFRTPDAGHSWDTLGHYQGGALHPATAETIFAALGSGSFSDGIWRSNDYGTTFDFPPPSWLFHADGAVFDPLDYSLVYAWGAEVIRSTDGGATWESVLSTPAGGTFGGVVVDPVYNHRVYAWDNAGEFFGSVDYGESWRSIFVFTESMSPNDIVVSHEDSSMLFAACWGGLAISRNCGLDWENHSLAEPPSNCIWASDISSDYLIIGGGYGVKISSDRGTTWSPLGDSITCQVLDFAVGPHPSLGDYWYIGTDRLGIKRIQAIPFTEGPIVSEFWPADSTWIACTDFDVFVRLRDADGIDSTSISFSVGGVAYDCYDDELCLSDSGLIFSTSFSDGDTLLFELTSVDDLLGNPCETLPLSWLAFVDRSSPRLNYRYPDSAEVIDDEEITAKLYFQDEGSGLDTSSFYAIFNSETLTLASPAVILDSDTFLVHLPTAGIEIEAGDTVWVEVSIQDKPDSCGPNVLNQSWYFSTYSIGIQDRNLPREYTISTYPNPFNSTVKVSINGSPLPCIALVEIFDLDGRRVDIISSVARNPIKHDGDFFPSGRNDGKNEFIWTPSPTITSGVYLIRATFSEQTASAICTKIIYLK
ncbi:hypothetical protein KAH81_04955 [bacterium]|nr:hypothetical protein [bacterium]